MSAGLHTAAPETILGGTTAAEALSTFTIFANSALVGATGIDTTLGRGS